MLPSHAQLPGAWSATLGTARPLSSFSMMSLLGVAKSSACRTFVIRRKSTCLRSMCCQPSVGCWNTVTPWKPSASSSREAETVLALPIRSISPVWSWTSMVLSSGTIR